MRARNLKPSLFKNELLAVADPLYTLIFEGLWCLADREGRLEDRPAKIHFDVNPGRSFDGTQAALAWLEDNGFIERYEVGGKKLIQVVNFTKHQNPHHREPDSSLPARSKPGASLGLALGKTGTSLSPAVLIPDSGSLTPDSGSLIPDSLRSSSERSFRPSSSERAREDRTILKKELRRRQLQTAVADLARAKAMP